MGARGLTWHQVVLHSDTVCSAFDIRDKQSMWDLPQAKLYSLSTCAYVPKCSKLINPGLSRSSASPNMTCSSWNEWLEFTYLSFFKKRKTRSKMQWITSGLACARWAKQKVTFLTAITSSSLLGPFFLLFRDGAMLKPSSVNALLSKLCPVHLIASNVIVKDAVMHFRCRLSEFFIPSRLASMRARFVYEAKSTQHFSLLSSKEAHIACPMHHNNAFQQQPLTLEQRPQRQ